MTRHRGGGGRRFAVVLVVLTLVGSGTAAAVGVGFFAGERLAGRARPAETAGTRPVGASSTTSTTTATTSPTTTTLPPVTSPTTTAPPTDPAAAVLRPGVEGGAVLALQRRLTDLGYWLGPVDGRYADLTRQAVLAFQKAEGLPRDGIAGPVTLERLGSADRLGARSTTGDLLEVDLRRQLLVVVRGGKVAWVLNTSTGASGTPTPPGRFTVQREIDGMRHAPLGDLYRPKYFDGGIAVHGFPSVPAHPASHGCARVSYPAMDMLWATGVAPVGTPVWVY